MTARKLLSLYADYLRPRIKMIRPKGYERPGQSDTDIRFQCWLRVVTEPNYPDYESDLALCLVKCEGDPMKQERIAEFEMSLSSSLEQTPFVYQEAEEHIYTPRRMIPITTAAFYIGVTPQAVHDRINRKPELMEFEKRGGAYVVSPQCCKAWIKEREGKKEVA